MREYFADFCRNEFQTAGRRQTEGRQMHNSSLTYYVYYMVYVYYVCEYVADFICYKKITGVVVITGPLQFSLQTTPTADPPVFTLTCVSTGGPATTVTWTRDAAIVSNDANHVFTKTVTNQLTATYANTLTVTGREPGNYTYSVANVRTDPPATASLTVAGE